jgi:hypothetical protein
LWRGRIVGMAVVYLVQHGENVMIASIAHLSIPPS